MISAVLAHCIAPVVRISAYCLPLFPSKYFGKIFDCAIFHVLYLILFRNKITEFWRCLLSDICMVISYLLTISCIWSQVNLLKHIRKKLQTYKKKSTSKFMIFLLSKLTSPANKSSDTISRQKVINMKFITNECLMSYVFIGVGFPMHRDLIWSIVRPL
jgi:hypothetical protein